MAPRVGLILGALVVAAAGASLAGGAVSDAGPEQSVSAFDSPAPEPTAEGVPADGTSGDAAAETGDDVPPGYESSDPNVPVAEQTRRQGGTRLIIPDIGLEVPIVEGTDEQALAQGVGRWQNDTKPGDRGNYVLAGHRVTNGEPFADLPQLRPGDEVVVIEGDYRYVYELDTRGDEYRVDDRELWPVRPIPKPMRGGPNRILTLITCAETFHTDDRFIAFGHLVDVSMAPGV